MVSVKLKEVAKGASDHSNETNNFHLALYSPAASIENHRDYSHKSVQYNHPVSRNFPGRRGHSKDSEFFKTAAGRQLQR